MISFLLTLSLIPLGYLSGGNWKSGLFSPIIGIVFGLLLHVTWYWLPLFALIGWIAESISPARYCTGLIVDRYKHVPDRKWAWFEIRYFREHPWLGVTFRGLLGALVYMPLCYIEPKAILMLTFIPAWPLALYIGTRFKDTWKIAESLRYALVGLLLL